MTNHSTKLISRGTPTYAACLNDKGPMIFASRSINCGVWNCAIIQWVPDTDPALSVLLLLLRPKVFPLLRASRYKILRSECGRCVGAWQCQCPPRRCLFPRAWRESPQDDPLPDKG